MFIVISVILISSIYIYTMRKRFFYQKIFLDVNINNEKNMFKISRSFIKFTFYKIL